LKTVQTINTSLGPVYVEVEEAVVPVGEKTETPTQIPVPEGAERTGAKEYVFDTLSSLRTSISALVNTTSEAFAETLPAEWSMEINIGFKGKSNPIPVILSGEANASLKVTAKWQKTKP
jgi:Trypsin-co-occurring domain 1